MKRLAVWVILGFALLVVPAIPVASAVELEPLKLGVRCDAPPFSFETSGGCADTGTVVASYAYDGYMVNLCRAAAQLLGRPIQLVAVDAQTRFDMLANGAIDVLCEPTTVTLDRLEKAAFSQIVFVSGVSYIYVPGGRIPPKGEALDETVHVGFLDGTTSEEVLGGLAAQGIFAVGTDLVRTKPYQRHRQGVRNVCEGKIDYYVGDRDIILHLMRAVPGCKAVASRKFFSREPYAIAVSHERPELAIDLQRALFRMFSEGELRRLFSDHFTGKAPSPILEGLFISQDISRSSR